MMNFIKRGKRLNFEKRYIAAPLSESASDGSGTDSTSGGGGGSSSSTYTNVSVKYFSNMYYDMADDVLQYFDAGVQVSSDTYWTFDYYADGTKISTAGAPIGTTMHTKNGSGSLNFIVKRPISRNGVYQDSWYIGSTLAESYTWLILQKAVAVAKMGSTYMSASTATTIDLNTTYAFSASESRGANTILWKVYKTASDLSYQHVLCTEGVDYKLISGTAGSADIQVQFLTQANYEVSLFVSGYTFSNNPYQIVAGDVSSNQNTLSFNLKPSNVVTTATLDVKFPTVLPKLIVPSAVDKTTTGGTFTTYAGQQILVQSELNLDAGYYKVISGSTTTVQTKTDDEWRSLIENKCNVVLEVRNVSTNELILSRTGLLDQTVVIPSEGSYKIQYKTTLK